MQSLNYMLDTNTARYIIKGNQEKVITNLKKVPMASICISAITEAELLHGLEKKPDAKQLPLIVN
jgi:tRNA(fMet)-specific endonuclease VapC